MESANEIHTGHSPVHPIHPQKLWHGILKVIRILAIPKTSDWKEETIETIMRIPINSSILEFALLGYESSVLIKQKGGGSIFRYNCILHKNSHGSINSEKCQKLQGKDTSHPVLSIHPRHLSHLRQIEVIPLVSKLEPETSLSLHVPCPLPSVSSVTPLKINIICKCWR